MSTGNIGKIKASRVNNVPNVESYLGEKGILFFNYANGVIRLSDGVTPGGVPIAYNIASNTTIGGIKAGAGANVGLDGTLTIDTSGLPLSIGNLDFIDTTISTLNPNVNLNLETNGTGNINLIGAVNFYKPDGPIESRSPFFRAQSDGQLTILVPVEDPIAGGVEIIGSATGNIIQPGQSGTMLHLTGNPNVAVRMYMDGIGDYAAIIGRRYNGNVAAPTQVLANQDVLRLNATAATTSGLGNVALAQIRMTALEDQTPTAQGSSITFTVTPIGSAASARVDVANVTVANGITATKFTTLGNVSAGNIISSGSVSASANITGGNIITTGLVSATGNITGSNVIAGGIVSAVGNVTAGNYTATGTGTYVGYYTHYVRDAGVIADAGTVTINFTTDDIVKCIWGNGLTVNYSNFIPGRSIRLIATKATGTGVDALNLGNISANQTSTGSATFNGTSDITYIIEFFSTSTSVTGLYAKI